MAKILSKKNGKKEWHFAWLPELIRQYRIKKNTNIRL